MKHSITLLILLIFGTLRLEAQEQILRAVLQNELGEGVSEAHVASTTQKVSTTEYGYFEMAISGKPAAMTISFSHVSYGEQVRVLDLSTYSGDTLKIVLLNGGQMLENIDLTERRKPMGLEHELSGEDIRSITSATGSVEGIVKTLPGVFSPNEMSHQYQVRGGNYDENLIYLNGMEIYKPFLVSSGQQEGLSYINPAMVDRVDFSAGGFDARYGDKMSSVLDIRYRTPEEFGASTQLSFIGGGLTVEDALMDGKLTYLVGARYYNNYLLVNSKDTRVNYDPRAADLQTYITYRLNSQWSFDALINLNLNEYNYEPKSRRTDFGTLDDPMRLTVFYQGNEEDAFNTTNLIGNAHFRQNDRLSHHFGVSYFQTFEKEYYDIEGAYRLSELQPGQGDEEIGENSFTRDIGSQLSHARNELEAQVMRLGYDGKYIDESGIWQWGISYQNDQIKDRVNEWEYVDSAGFSLGPGRENGELPLYQNVYAYHELNAHRLQSYLQWEKEFYAGEERIFINAGMRSHYYSVNGQCTFSPRMNLRYSPSWNEALSFRLSSGLYHQPPFYREMRAPDGALNKEVKAQQSFTNIIGAEYRFVKWGRNFKFFTELYYKDIQHLNPYSVDNIRIRYAAHNDAKGFVYGMDMRLHGEFVKGAESWFNFSLMQAKENIAGKGYISRPSDQTARFNIVFRDYVPRIPSLRVNINMIYATPLPSGTPKGGDPYDYRDQFDLNAYKRLDIGLSKVFVSPQHPASSNSVLKHFKELVLSLEGLNIANMQNAISNTWVRDVYSKSMYAVPNYMTGRIWNVKLDMRF